MEHDDLAAIVACLGAGRKTNVNAAALKGMYESYKTSFDKTGHKQKNKRP